VTDIGRTIVGKGTFFTKSALSMIVVPDLITLSEMASQKK
jgi:hypothetical protein